MKKSTASLSATLLDSEDLARLARPRTGRVLLDIGRHWVLIVSSWAAVAYEPSFALICLALVVIGTQANALLVIAHDGMHRRIAEPVSLNDLIVDWCILGAVGAVNRLNRTNHIEHHKELATPADPDRPNYVHSTRPDRLHFLLFFTGTLSLFRQARNIFRGVSSGQTPLDRRYRVRDVLVICIWQAALIGGLTWFVGWWAYPILWLLPLYVFYFITDMARVFAEHSELAPDDAADRGGRLVTFYSNPVERLVMSPHNMNLHSAHHLWPSIPYFNLPEADRLLREKIAGRQTGLKWRDSYLGYFVDYFRAMPNFSARD